jgi:hypothetical protein
MAHEQKTSIGDRNILVQHGAGNSTTVWLEIELSRHQRTAVDCVALTGDEAITLGRAIVQAGMVANAREGHQQAMLLSTEG